MLPVWNTKKKKNGTPDQLYKILGPQIEATNTIM